MGRCASRPVRREYAIAIVATKPRSRKHLDKRAEKHSDNRVGCHSRYQRKPHVGDDVGNSVHYRTVKQSGRTDNGFYLQLAGCEHQS